MVSLLIHDISRPKQAKLDKGTHSTLLFSRCDTKPEPKEGLEFEEGGGTIGKTWYFVTIIVLTYCEKKISSVRKKNEKKVCKFEAVRPRICNVFKILFSSH